MFSEPSFQLWRALIALLDPTVVGQDVGVPVDNALDPTTRNGFKRKDLLSRFSQALGNRFRDGVIRA